MVFLLCGHILLHVGATGIPTMGETPHAGMELVRDLAYARRMERSITPKPWGVVVVEDDARTRQFFGQCVQDCKELRLLASLGSVQEALDWIDRSTEAPDVLLTDLGLPDGSGITVLHRMGARFPGCEALVVSMFGDEEHVLASIEAGALGYVHKDSAPENVAQTILELKAGASPISPGIARRLLTRYRGIAAANPASPAAPVTPQAPPTVAMSPRETEILDLLARGFSYSEIADLCKLSRNTVASHVKNLYRKLQVSSRGEAVFEGLQSGLIKPLSDR
jgi:DNA-binding NarL/FixJ family response regulator